jgi:perosamine synthetase
MAMFNNVVDFIKQNYKEKENILLHEPVFFGNEKKYLNECIDSTFVSSVGPFVDRFEHMVADYTGAKYAIAIVNGTAALHVALKLVGVDENTEVITQPLSFIATCNAISYCGAEPVFVDVDRDTMGLSPHSLMLFLEQQTEQRNGACYNKITGKRIAGVVPMHTFGNPCRIDKIALLCEKHNIPLVEDAAESLGSYYKGKHTGLYSDIAVFSFNGNKTITTGGGGMIITNSEELAIKAKHLTTTAKLPHAYEFVHDEIAYNYRLPNINAALGCAQMENLADILKSKKEISTRYKRFFSKHQIDFVAGIEHSEANCWLNAVVLNDKSERDDFLKETNEAGVMTRPVWSLMSSLEMFKFCQKTDLINSLWLEERVVNIPSGPRV